MEKKSPKIGRPATGQVPQRQIRATDEQWTAWDRAAAAAGVTRSEWMRQILDRAARRKRKP